MHTLAILVVLACSPLLVVLNSAVKEHHTHFELHFIPPVRGFNSVPYNQSDAVPTVRVCWAQHSIQHHAESVQQVQMPLLQGPSACQQSDAVTQWDGMLAGAAQQHDVADSQLWEPVSTAGTGTAASGTVKQQFDDLDSFVAVNAQVHDSNHSGGNAALPPAAEAALSVGEAVLAAETAATGNAVLAPDIDAQQQPMALHDSKEPAVLQDAVVAGVQTEALHADGVPADTPAEESTTSPAGPAAAMAGDGAVSDTIVEVAEGSSSHDAVAGADAAADSGHGPAAAVAVMPLMCPVSTLAGQQLAGAMCATTEEPPAIATDLSLYAVLQYGPSMNAHAAGTDKQEQNAAADSAIKVDAITLLHEGTTVKWQLWQLLQKFTASFWQHMQCWQTVWQSTSAASHTLALPEVYSVQGALLVFLALMALMVASWAGYSCLQFIRHLLPSKGPLQLLPLRAHKDPQQLDACYTLRQLSTDCNSWYRLLGVSGAAVCMAEAAQQHSQRVVAKAQGGACFARALLQQQKTKLAHVTEQKLAVVQQQLDKQQQHELQQQRLASEAAASKTASIHHEQLATFQQEINQLQQQRDKQQRQIKDLQDRERELVADMRSKADVVAEQRAVLGTFNQQLIELKSEKAGLSHELRQVLDQLAKERGRVEAMLHEEEQVKGQADHVKVKYEILQDQLSEVRSSNAQLTNELQHLQAAVAAAETTIQELRRDRQTLQGESVELQQQLRSSSSQLAEARSQNCDYASKLIQLKQHSVNLQEQLLSTQALHADASGQLQKLQGQYAAAEATIQQLHNRLSASDAQVADSRATIADLQAQLRQQQERLAEMRSELAAANASAAQLRGGLQQVQALHAAAQASIVELRREQQGMSGKADQVQQQLANTVAELTDVRSQHATALAQLQQHQQDKATLQEQLAASKAKSKQQSAEIASLQQQQAAADSSIQQLQETKQRLQDQAAQLQAQTTLHKSTIEQLNTSLQLEGVLVMEKEQQLQQLTVVHQQLVKDHEELDQNLLESTQLLEEREMQLTELQTQKADLEQHLAATDANLKAKTATLRQAQESLSDTTGRLQEEEDRNMDLGRENAQLQEQLDRLREDNRQLEQYLDEVSVDRDRVTAQLEDNNKSFNELLTHSLDMHGKTEALLAENLDQLVELQGKLTAAQAGLNAVTAERDELAKKLYWAEIARDQHGAANKLATQDAIKAMKALSEEKILRRHTPSPTGAVPILATAGHAGLAGTEEQRVLLRSNSCSKKWPTVEAGYLTPKYSDATPHAGSQSARSHHSSPGSPSELSPAASTHTSGLSGVAGPLSSPPASRSSSAPCTPRSGDDILAISSTCSVSTPTRQQQEQQHKQRQQHAVEPVSVGAEGCPQAAISSAAAAGGLAQPAQRSNTIHIGQAASSTSNDGSISSQSPPETPSSPTAAAMAGQGAEQGIQEAALTDTADAGQQGHAQLGQRQQGQPSMRASSDDTTKEARVAAAVEGLRAHFTAADDQQGATAATAQEQPYTAPFTCSRDAAQARSQQQQGQQQQQQVLPYLHQQQQPLHDSASPKSVTPQPEEAQSPSIRTSGSRASRSDRSDRSLLPLALSPVPFDLAASSDMTPASSVIANSSGPAASVSSKSPGAGADGGSAAATPAHKWRQQQQVVEFYTPLQEPRSHVQGQVSPAAAAAEPGSRDSSSNGASGASTPYFTPRPAAAPAAADTGAGVTANHASPVSVATGPSSSHSRSHATNNSSNHSYHDLDDDACVLLGSLTEAEFMRSLNLSASSAASVSAFGGVNGHGSVAVKDGCAGGILAAVAVQQQQQKRQEQQLGNQQEQQPAKLTKNQKKKQKQRLKKLAARQQQQQGGIDVGASDDTVFASVEASSVSQSPASCNSEVTDDVPTADGLPDSPPKMFVGRAKQAAAAAGSCIGGNSRRYSNSPMRGRGLGLAAAAAVSNQAATADDSGDDEATVADIDDSTAVLSGAATTVPESSSGNKRLRVKAAGINNTRAPAMRSITALGKLQGAADSGNSRAVSPCAYVSAEGVSPQRYRSKFGVAGKQLKAAASTGDVEAFQDLHSQWGLSAVHNVPMVGAECSLQQLTKGAAEAQSSSQDAPLYRSSVHWKPLSDSLSEPILARADSNSSLHRSSSASPRVGRTGSRQQKAAVQAAEQQQQDGAGWKVAENMLYFD